MKRNLTDVSANLDGLVWSQSKILFVVSTGWRIIWDAELFTDPLVAMEVGISQIIDPHSSFMQ